MKSPKIDLNVPADVVTAAREGLALRQALPYAGSGSGQRMAERLACGKPMTASAVRRLATYFASHDQPRLVGSTGRPHRMHVAWLLRGGDAGRAWAERVVAALDAAAVVPEQERRAVEEPAGWVKRAC
ncbi:hypothetical protein HNQ07_000890 [Deinococcus metalli]|uniref:Uncharacterized protein n=1 Tax=Deinococcus metalli TaxID=1141878 RepID=A0A7W8KC87_9DEIO|nr:DNA-binding protein [Deinococcus metalli]MBB5375446.1 hypothetical protein [Deinococcus metalli]GHF29219.1 hypothetical protein GCM10017781_01490 [Deinococcus metalli]